MPLMANQELAPPPSAPVWWRVISYSVADWALHESLRPKRVRVFAKTWFEARALAMVQIPGAENIELQQEAR